MNRKQLAREMVKLAKTLLADWKEDFYQKPNVDPTRIGILTEFDRQLTPVEMNFIGLTDETKNIDWEIVDGGKYFRVLMLPTERNLKLLNVGAKKFGYYYEYSSQMMGV